MTQVNVIIPLYGEHRARHVLKEVTESWLAQEVACEVLLVTAGDIPVTVASDIDGQRRVRVIRADPADQAPGLLRNVGAEQASAPLLYLSDADIAPLGRDYLTRALRLAGKGVLAQPWMHRLTNGPLPLPAVECRPPEQKNRCFVAVAPDGVLHVRPGEEILWKVPSSGDVQGETPRARLPREGEFPCDRPSEGATGNSADRQEWCAPYHWGSMLLTRDLFRAVGGYCLQYAGWGGEDADLLVKVAARAPLTRGWQSDTSWRCLHFEHPASHRGTPEHLANNARYNARRAKGPESMIAQDLAWTSTPPPSATSGCSDDLQP
ncbi:glycosyltransferase family 2 protein [Streptomyces sp. NPDC050636]|uniref:glycosyltransferase family 2 protein n=1 Tax=Streptomyces sp. NPDC050636 TaxID=3154510 RepID=UPI00342DE6BC